MQTTSSPARTRVQSLMAGESIQRLLALAALVILLVFFSIVVPHFASTNNYIDILTATAVNGVLATGVTFVIITGGIDLSVGTTMTLCSVIMGLVVTNAGLPLWLGIPAALAGGALVGLVNGILIAKLKLPPFIATLGMLVAARGLALTLSGGLPIAGLPHEFMIIGAGYWGPVPIPAVIAAVSFVVAFFVLSRTRFGRYVYAMGSNEEAAILSGINVVKYKILVYVVSGLFAGIAGVVLTSRVISGQPTLGEVQELYSIAAVVIGGGKITGGVGGIGRTLMGVLVLGMLSNGLNLIQISSYVQNIVVGAIIVIAVYIDLARERRR